MPKTISRAKRDLLNELDDRAKVYAEEMSVSVEVARWGMIDALVDVIGTGCDDDFELDSLIREYIRVTARREKKKGE